MLPKLERGVGSLMMSPCETGVLQCLCVLWRGAPFPPSHVRQVRSLQVFWGWGAAPSSAFPSCLPWLHVFCPVYMPGHSQWRWESNSWDLWRSPKIPKVQCRLIHSSCLNWAQQSHTVGSHNATLWLTCGKKNCLKDEENKTGEEILKETGMFNFQNRGLTFLHAVTVWMEIV